MNGGRSESPSVTFTVARRVELSTVSSVQTHEGRKIQKLNTGLMVKSIHNCFVFVSCLTCTDFLLTVEKTKITVTLGINTVS